VKACRSDLAEEAKACRDAEDKWLLLPIMKAAGIKPE